MNLCLALGRLLGSKPWRQLAGKVGKVLYLDAREQNRGRQTLRLTISVFPASRQHAAFLRSFFPTDTVFDILFTPCQHLVHECGGGGEER